MSDTEEDSNSSDSIHWPICERWLSTLLNRFHRTTNCKILNYTVKDDFQVGASNLSDLLAVFVKYELPGNTAGHPVSIDLIIKLLPSDPFSRYFVTEAKFDLREIQFYTKILPELLDFQAKHVRDDVEPMKISVPIVYHTQYSPGIDDDDVDGNHSPTPPDSMIVLQDMRPMGYKSANFKKGLNLQEAEAAICTIAVVHALSLGMKTKNKIDLNKEYPFLFQISKATESYQQLVEQGLPQLSKFLERLEGHQNELIALNNLRDKTRLIIENLLQPIEPMGLITHTDFWCNNLLLKETPDGDKSDNCVILDWQMVTYSRPTNDIALLIISSLSSAIRRENTGKLLDLYYTQLKMNLSKISINLEVDLEYSRENLDRDYKKSQLLALLLCIGSVDIALGNQEAEQRFLDVLHDLYDGGILNIDEISI